VAYAVENALFQWREGERYVRDADDPLRLRLERVTDVVLAELRRRLGSSFLIGELASFYAEGTDWAAELAQRHTSGTDVSYVVDAAFARYAREASDYAGGRPRESHGRPETA
jgi:hypothetical protein